MASADATSPRSWKGEITEANADGEEIIEVPQATLPVRPGHLWCEADSELVDDDTGRGAICDLMLKLHADLVRRFEKQEESIGRMQRMGHVSRRPVPMAPPSSARPSEANTSRHSTSEPGEEEDECDAPIGSPRYRRHSLNIAPRLFSTFQDYDHALYDIATNADARISRARFAAKNSGATQGHDTYSCCSGISRRVARCVKRPCFDMLCAVAVITNSVFLGIEVEVNRDNPDGISAPMIVVQYMYAGWFLTELLLRITADGCRHFFCADDWAWSMLDLFVVLSSVWEVATDIVLAVQQDDMGDVNSMTGLRAFRIVRITRIVKVVRLMRVFRFVSAFRTLIASIADTLKSLFWALMLLVVIVYVFAVLFTQAVNDYVMDETNPLLPDEELEAAQKYYGTLLDTMLFLFMTISDGISYKMLRF